MTEPIFNNLIIVLLYRWLSTSWNTCSNCNLCDVDIYDEIEIET